MAIDRAELVDAIRVARQSQRVEVEGSAPIWLVLLPSRAGEILAQAAEALMAAADTFEDEE